MGDLCDFVMCPGVSALVVYYDKASGRTDCVCVEGGMSSVGGYLAWFEGCRVGGRPAVFMATEGSGFDVCMNCEETPGLAAMS